MKLDFFKEINFANPEILFGFFLLPLIIFICHINLDSISRKSLKENFHKSALSILYAPKNNIIFITILRSLFFCFLIIALAGPRWSFHDVTTKTDLTNNLILLDVSKSMNAIDFLPNRFEQAKRRIDQIINSSDNYGLVAFAKTSYNLIPFTSDQEYIKNYLRNIKLTDFSNEGSNFNFSLDLIIKINKVTPLNNVYIVSDFDFSEQINKGKLEEISELNINLIPIKIATDGGSPIKDVNGSFVNYQGSTVISKPSSEIINLLETLKQKQDQINKETMIKNHRVYEEEYYLFLFPLMLIFLLLNKRSAFLILIFIISNNFSINHAYANPLLNTDQNAKIKYDEELYKDAYKLFSDDYNKAVAAYRDGDYESAIKHFGKDETLESNFNLGNSLLMNEQIDEAIAEYEKILVNYPDHEKTKTNLAIAKNIKRNNKTSSKDDENKKNQEQEKQKNNENNSKSDQNNQETSENNQQNKEEHTGENSNNDENKSSTKPTVKKQQNNYSSEIEKFKNQNLKNQIDKSKNLQSQYVVYPW
jgi:Ca-activated chloride channel family protein